MTVVTKIFEKARQRGHPLNSSSVPGPCIDVNTCRTSPNNIYFLDKNKPPGTSFGRAGHLRGVAQKIRLQSPRIKAHKVYQLGGRPPETTVTVTVGITCRGSDWVEGSRW